nr:MAG TPA: Major tail protein [Caudoviricetes sp.]
MAYISPNTEVRIYSGVPLDRNYNHTVKQTSLSTQLTMFAPYLKYTLTNLSYQRSGKNTIRVSRLADTLYDCNYMAFQNTAYGNKWFYAFIDHVEYINNNTSEITYTIDVMQTWYFDYDLGECYVEREHTETDAVGDNLVPENLDTGELVVNNKLDYFYPRKSENPIYYLVVIYVANSDKGYIVNETRVSDAVYTYGIQPCRNSAGGNPLYLTGEIVNGVYMGCHFWGVPLKVDTSSDRVNTNYRVNGLIQTILGGDIGGTIVNIAQVPAEIYTAWSATIEHPIYTDVIGFSYDEGFKGITDKKYYPLNKKMYTSPFRNIVISNNSGQSATYKWEYTLGRTSSGKNMLILGFQGVPFPMAELFAYPRQYRGLDNDYESGISLTDFPQPPWSEDSFTKWWTQNGDAYITSMLTSAVTTIAGVATAPTNPASTLAAIGGAVGIANNIGRFVTAKNTPDQISGQSNVSSLRTVQGRIGFTVYDMGVEYSVAKVIDNYFSMFGYAIKQLKVPNIKKTGAKLRPNWNYIKTLSCVIHSAAGKGLPTDDEEAIAKIYDKGITFWTAIGNIGDYSLDNSPQEVIT